MIEQIFKAINVAGVNSYLGPEWLDIEDGPPSIVWVPKDGVIETGQGKSRTIDVRTRSVYTAHVAVSVRLWSVWPAGTPFPTGYDQGESDYQSLWDLLRRFLISVYDASVGSVRPTDVRYLTENGQVLVEFGKALEVDLEFDIPITRDASTVATITALEQEEDIT